MLDFYALGYFVLLWQEKNSSSKLGCIKKWNLIFIYWIHSRFSFLFCMFIFIFCQRKSHLTQCVIKFSLGSSSPFHLRLNWYSHRSQQRKWESSYLVCMYPHPCEVTSLCSPVIWQLWLLDSVWSPGWAHRNLGTPSRPHCVLRQLRLSLSSYTFLGTPDISPLFFPCSSSNPIWRIKF